MGSRKAISFWRRRSIESEIEALGLVDHPGGKALQEFLEALHMLHGELILRVGPFQCPAKTGEPDLPRMFVDLKRKMARPHSRWSVFLEIQRRSSQQSDEKRCGFFRRFFHVGREEFSQLRRLQLSVEIPHHFKDVGFSHHSKDCAAGTRTLRWPAGWGINDSIHRKIFSRIYAKHGPSEFCKGDRHGDFWKTSVGICRICKVVSDSGSSGRNCSSRSFTEWNADRDRSL